MAANQGALVSSAAPCDHPSGWARPFLDTGSVSAALLDRATPPLGSSGPAAGGELIFRAGGPGGVAQPREWRGEVEQSIMRVG